MTTPGTYRHLTQCSTTAGHFVILAIDHRATLRNKLDEQAGAPVSDAAFAAFKQQVLRHLSPASSAVLADPSSGFGPGIASGVISGQVGLLAPVEVTDYDTHPSLRSLVLMDGWSVAKIKRVGGAGVKMLIHYHPEADNAQQVLATVTQIAEDCVRYDIPFFPEPIPFSPDPTVTLAADEWTQLVIECARVFGAMGAVLKTPFPVDVKQMPDEVSWGDALAAFDAACPVPWALLSAGVDYATFKRQAEAACKHGASGIIAGRALWAEAITLQDDAREQFLMTTGRERMEELAHICAAYATSWREKVPAPQLDSLWYHDYADFS
ncbi:MAG: tagatose 1,6-diphosphate aldolase [Chloroflexi bacterium]|nr:MAG: hypothetical protein CUN54_01775 [Phototrophicales bacterium]RMF80700.1 MAG: tagatose 1,6-diphosphate aldolase [Chloroflexota bacterium]